MKRKPSKETNLLNLASRDCRVLERMTEQLILSRNLMHIVLFCFCSSVYNDNKNSSNIMQKLSIL